MKNSIYHYFTQFFNLKIIAYGALLGIADLIPGFSAATMAMILNIYEYLISIIADSLRDWKSLFKYLNFLIPLGLGLLFSIILFSPVIHYSLIHYHYQIFSLFLGIIISTYLFLYKKNKALTQDEKISCPFKMIYFILGMLLPLSILYAKIFSKNTFFYNFSIEDFLIFKKAILLFPSGMLVSFAMILPGISGSLLLILLDLYSPVITMLQIQNIIHYFIPLSLFTLGIISGILLGGWMMHFLLNQFRYIIHQIILGIIAGSAIYILTSEILLSPHNYLIVIVFIIIGYSLNLLLNKFNPQ